MSDHHALAAQILDEGPERTLGEHLSARQIAEWTAAAQAYIDHDGDSADLQLLLDDSDLWDEFCGQAQFWPSYHGGDYMDFDMWKQEQAA